MLLKLNYFKRISERLRLLINSNKSKVKDVIKSAEA
jgi:hypothetical protein